MKWLLNDNQSRYKFNDSEPKTLHVAGITCTLFCGIGWT